MMQTAKTNVDGSLYTKVLFGLEEISKWLLPYTMQSLIFLLIWTKTSWPIIYYVIDLIWGLVVKGWYTEHFIPDNI